MKVIPSNEAQLSSVKSAKEAAQLQGRLAVFDEYEQTALKEKTVEDLPFIDLQEMLEYFQWQASGDASDLEVRFNSELQALEKVFIDNLIGKRS